MGEIPESAPLSSGLEYAGGRDGKYQGRGLTQQEARDRLSKVGPNEPMPVRRTWLLRRLLGFFAEPLVAILLIASLLSAAVGDLVNASIIVIMVFLSVALNFYQTSRANRAAERLRKEVAPTATVLRDGEWIETARREIVPGDVVRLSAGDMIPADARLVEERDLYVQEAPLTGESLPVEKRVQEGQGQGRDTNDGSGNVYLGSSVVSGAAVFCVMS